MFPRRTVGSQMAIEWVDLYQTVHRLRGALAPAAETLDAAFLGAALLSPVRDPDGRIVDALCVDVTPGASAVLGVEEDELIGRSAQQIAGGRLRGDPVRLVRRVLSEGASLECPFEPAAANAADALRARFSPHPRGLLVTWSAAPRRPDDAPDLEEMERRALRAEARLVDSFIASPDPFALFDRDDCLVLCNEAWLEVFGLSGQETVTGRPLEELIAVAGSTGTGSGYVSWRRDRRMDGAEDNPDEAYEVMLADGRTFRMRERRTRDGGAVSLGAEVTEIIRQREVMHRALDAINTRVAVFDPQHRLVVWNQAYAEVFGSDLIQPGLTFESCSRLSLQRDDAVTYFEGRPVTFEERMALHREKRPELSFERRYADGSVSLVTEVQTPGGWIVITGTTITELKAKESVLRARVAELAEVTEQLRVEKERAEAANRTKSQFLANMSHELRTPLNAILGFSEILMLEAFGPLGEARYREYAEDIHGSGDHLLSLINEILDMSKVEAGKFRLDLKEVSLCDVVERAVRMMRGRVAEAELHLQVERIDPDLVLRMDPRAIQQVLINLLANAVKFTPEHGQLSLTHTEEIDSVLVTLTDTGRGIDPADIPRLLRPFERAHSMKARRVEGTGLGLPLSHALVGLHGGDLTIESEPGVGTSVMIRLPRG